MKEADSLESSSNQADANSDKVEVILDLQGRPYTAADEYAARFVRFHYSTTNRTYRRSWPSLKKTNSSIYSNIMSLRLYPSFEFESCWRCVLY